MPVIRKSADNFFKIMGKRAVDLGGRAPRDLGRIPDGDADIWAFIEEEKARGPNRVFTFRAADGEAAFKRAEKRVETMEIKRAILGKIVGVDPEDGEPVFRDISILSFVEKAAA